MSICHQMSKFMVTGNKNAKTVLGTYLSPEADRFT